MVHNAYRIPGMEAAAVVPGEGCWVNASGDANRARHEPLTVDDEFPIGSITKTFTATVILQLVQEGKLSLTAPISNWVPSVQYASQITVEMLLDMTSGIWNEANDNGQVMSQILDEPTKVWTPQEVVATAVSHGPAGPPGGYYYSDPNYVILGIIAQAITGEPINQLIRSRILQPLHLTHTFFPTATPRPRLVHGYSIENTVGRAAQKVVDVTNVATSPAYVSFAGASGAMISTLGDLEVWAKAFGTGELLSTSMQRQVVLITSKSQPFGYYAPLPFTSGAPLPVRNALSVLSAGSMLGEDGSIDGYRVAMFYQRAKRATIVVLLNGGNPEKERELGEFVLSDPVAVSISSAIHLP